MSPFKNLLPPIPLAEQTPTVHLLTAIIEQQQTTIERLQSQVEQLQRRNEQQQETLQQQQANGEVCLKALTLALPGAT